MKRKSHFIVFAFWLFVGISCKTTTNISTSVEPSSPTPAKYFVRQPHILDNADDSGVATIPPPKILQTLIPEIDTFNAFLESYLELSKMLKGEIPADFERAVFLSESPYYLDAYSYKDFEKALVLPLYMINALIEANDHSDSINFDVSVGPQGKFAMNDISYLPEQKRSLYLQTLANWAIFAFITDTTLVYPLQHHPFEYNSGDPFGTKDWSNSLVTHLLLDENPKGNCYAMTALFKILSNRLESDARLCTAPQHIYIQHKDTKGDYYNVELATAGFPRDGTIQTLTHSSSDAIRNGIALREYDEIQSIGLCMIQLAKSFEHTYGTKSHDFLLQCAETVLQNDSLNLNALLLKQQVLDDRLLQYCKLSPEKDIAQLRKDLDIRTILTALESHNAKLYALGYREMPIDMQKIILSGIAPTATSAYNPTPFASIKTIEDKENTYTTLYNGIFQEVFRQEDKVQYGHFTYNTHTRHIEDINIKAQDPYLIDPVAFAYDFGARIYDARIGRWMKPDDYEKLSPAWTPYRFGLDNPIIFIDPDGNDEYYFNNDGTWFVTRWDGVDQFFIQGSVGSTYRLMDIYASTKSLNGFITDVLGEDDGDIVSMYMSADPEFSKDLSNNIANKGDNKQYNALKTNAALIPISNAVDAISDVLSFGEKPVLKNVVKLSIKKAPNLLDEVVVTTAKTAKTVKELGKAKYGRYKIIFNDGSEYVGRTIQEFKKRMGQHFGKGGKFAGKAGEVKEIVYQELEGVKRKALKFKEQEWLDEAKKVAEDTGAKILNKINAARKKKQ